MLSKVITDLEQQTRALESFLETHGEAISTGIAARAEKLELGVEPPPDTGVQQLLTVALNRGRLQLVGADRIHTAEKVGDPPARQARDEAAALMRLRLQQVRRLVEGMYGPLKADAVMGFDGSPSPHPVIVQRQAEQVLERLQDPELLPPDEEIQILLGGPQGLIALVEAPLDRLSTNLDQVLHERRKVEGTKATKDSLLQEQRHLLRSAAGMLAALSLLADRPDLARRARALVRRRRKPVAGEPAPEPTVPEPESPAPDPPVEEPVPAPQGPPQVPPGPVS